MPQVFPDVTFYTHMPFIFELNGRQVLLFCQQDTTPRTIETPKGPIKYLDWKICYTDWQDEKDPIHVLNTQLPPASLECSPSAYVRGNTIYLSFMAAVRRPEGGLSAISLFTMEGTSLESMSQPQNVTSSAMWSSRYLPDWFSGFRSPLITAVGERTTEHVGGFRKTVSVFYTDHTKPSTIMKLTLNMPTLFRIIYDPLHPEKMLLTGDRIVNGQRAASYTVVCDINTQTLLGEIVLPDNTPVYKCTTFDDEIVYAKKVNTGVEQRQLSYEAGYTLKPTTDITATWETTPSTRPAPPPQPRYQHPIDTPLSTPQGPGMFQRFLNATKAAGRVVSNVVQGKEVFISEEEAARRLAICQACEFFDGSTCTKCGCFLKWKKMLATERCPLNPPKW